MWRMGQPQPVSVTPYTAVLLPSMLMAGHYFYLNNAVMGPHFIFSHGLSQQLALSLGVSLVMGYNIGSALQELLTKRPPPGEPPC